jgi:hypothetical protein
MSRFAIVRWLQTIARQSRHAPGNRRLAGRLRQPRCVPRLEALEDRTVLSPLLVTNLNDSGAGSLRAAVQAADGTSGAVIDFAKGLHGTITLTSGQLKVTSNMTIDGPGANLLTVSGDNASRIFDVSNSATATIDEMTVANGAALSTRDPSLQGGGGVLNEVGSTVYLNNDVFSNNHALVVGGALWNQAGPTGSGTVFINNSAFIGNQALGSVNGTTNPFMLFEGFAPGNGTAEGGAIDNDGSLTIADSNFTNNQAVGVPGSDNVNASGHGGAVAADGTLSITGSTFTGNEALGATVPSGFASSQGLGGAVVVFDTATISDSTFLDNEAVGGAGGTGAANSPAFVGAGGGILVLNGATLNVSGSTFAGNEAIGGAGGTSGGGGFGIGGGIDAHAGTTLTLSNSSFHDNAAIGGAGGSGGAGGAGIGGGLSVDVFSTATITGIALLGNQAVGGAGGVGANGGSGYGGGISVGGRTIYDGPDGTSVSLSDSVINDNLALGGSGGLGGNGGSGLGGGVFVGATEGGITPSLTVSESTINANNADGGAGSGGGSTGSGVGGGVYDLGNFSTIDTVINGNKASTSNDDIFPS